MPPKRLSATGRRRAKIQPKPSPPPAEQPDQPDQRDQPDQPDQLNLHSTGHTQSREPRSPTPPSREGSVVSVASNSRKPNDQAKKRATKIDFALTVEQEESMLEFLQAKPIIWDCKLNGYRRTNLKNKLWEDQGASMEPPRSYKHLQGWFKSLWDTHTRLHKKKSGDGAPAVELTERELWIRDQFGFLKSVIRHRPEPCKTVKATIQEHQGDLCAAEAACVDIGATLDDVDMPTVTKGKGKGKRLHEDSDDALLTSLQKTVQQSGKLLAGLQPVPQQPVTSRTTFANYVRDSLLSMDKPKFKKARLAINRILSELMADDSDDDTPMPLPNIPQVRPMYDSCSSSSSASKYPSPSEPYQPAPHMWKPHPPQSSVWASQSQEYMDSYWQQQHHQLVARPEQQSMAPRPHLPFKQQQQTPTPVAGAIASASQALIPTLGMNTSLVGSLNLSSISNISGLSGLSDMAATNIEMDTPPQNN